jgi:hypothetical protein
MVGLKKFARKRLQNWMSGRVEKYQQQLQCKKFE